ncbi:MAG: hypothetical protein QOD51_2232, partial [Candidatus Eremiobacteraeota bacterium]|jgi:hypothetical protein|nr:hypothetical protein [Candidatus Eremiobacteraeota bacterium]
MARSFNARKTFEQELRGQPVFQTGLVERAAALAVFIRAAAEPARNTGYYIRRVVPVRNRVQIRDPFGHLSEYGSKNNPPYAPARRGVRASGLRFEDGRVDEPGPTA